MSEIHEEMFHNKHSKSTTSGITYITVSKINTWKSKPLDKGYC
ncbi:hypothetical protein ACNF40_06125 [Cuniculiplasma sp. SKW4]